MLNPVKFPNHSYCYLREAFQKKLMNFAITNYNSRLETFNDSGNTHRQTNSHRYDKLTHLASYGSHKQFWKKCINILMISEIWQEQRRRCRESEKGEGYKVWMDRRCICEY